MSAAELNYIKTEIDRWYGIMYSGEMSTDYCMDRIYELEAELMIWI